MTEVENQDPKTNIKTSLVNREVFITGQLPTFPPAKPEYHRHERF